MFEGESTLYVRVITLDETVKDDSAEMSAPPVADTEPVLVLNSKLAGALRINVMLVPEEKLLVLDSVIIISSKG